MYIGVFHARLRLGMDFATALFLRDGFVPGHWTCITSFVIMCIVRLEGVLRYEGYLQTFAIKQALFL